MRRQSRVVSNDSEILLKFLLVGDSGVGKSSLLLRFTEDTYCDSYKATIGLDFKVRTVTVDGQRVKIQIWDTAGQERFGTIPPTYYRNTHGVIIVYDVNKRESYNNVKKWASEIDGNCDFVERLLVGNKDDDPSEKSVSTDESQQFAKAVGLHLFETSAKENVNVDDMFISMARTVLNSKKYIEHTQFLKKRPETVRLKKLVVPKRLFCLFPHDNR